jgi:methionyl aminopeptidase
MTTIKSAAEIELMRVAGGIVYEALELARSLVRPGLTSQKLDRAIESFIRSKGAKPSFKNYQGFPAASCISINEMVVHGIPSERQLIDGDIVSVDIGAYIGGYHADAARTFPVGTVKAETLRLVRITEECFFEAIKVARPGNRIGDIGYAVQSYAEAAGYSVVRELIGHGVGQALHESPDVPNYGRAGHGLRLEAGMTIAIEPMINMGVREVRRLSDGWGIVTQDGLPSAHYENTIALTDGEPLILTLQ